MSGNAPVLLKIHPIHFVAFMCSSDAQLGAAFANTGSHTACFLSFQFCAQKLSSGSSLQKEELAGWHPNHTQHPSGDSEVREVVLRRELSQDSEKPSELSSGEEMEEWEQKQSLSQCR